MEVVTLQSQISLKKQFVFNNGSDQKYNMALNGVIEVFLTHHLMPTQCQLTLHFQAEVHIAILSHI